MRALLRRVRTLLRPAPVLPEVSPEVYERALSQDAYALALHAVQLEEFRRELAASKWECAEAKLESARLRAALEAHHEAALPDLLDKQAGSILRVLERWCSQKPGRGFRASRSPDGRWSASLIECERRTMRGADLGDALGQIAQAASGDLVDA